jgi:hypothetical protein
MLLDGWISGHVQTPLRYLEGWCVQYLDIQGKRVKGNTGVEDCVASRVLWIWAMSRLQRVKARGMHGGGKLVSASRPMSLVNHTCTLYT